MCLKYAPSESGYHFRLQHCYIDNLPFFFVFFVLFRGEICPVDLLLGIFFSCKQREREKELRREYFYTEIVSKFCSLIS